MGRENNKVLNSCLVLLFICLLGSSCVKDKPIVQPQFNISDTGKVYIVCEGAYMDDNASLYSYNSSKKTVTGDIYKSINGTPLGDVFQSMTKIGDNFFLAVNNSNKVVIINAKTYQLIGTISIPQPRYILYVGNNKAYISSMYGNKMYVINTQTLLVTGTIILPNKNPECMYCYSNNAIVCTWDTSGNHIYRINTQTDQTMQSIAVAGYAPQEVTMDRDGYLWVLAGNEYYNKVSTLTKLDTLTGEQLQSFKFNSNINPMRLTFNATYDTLYFIEANYNLQNTNNGIYRMGIYDNVLPNIPFIAAPQNTYFYGLGIDKQNNNIYIGNPNSWGHGIVSVYNGHGVALDSFKVGVGPGHFFFDN